MKQKRCVIRLVLNYILFLLLFNSLSTFALVNLFDKLHLYELNIDRPDEIRSYGGDLKQSFAYYVNGSGYCAAKSRNEPFITNNNPTKDDDFKLETNVLIYANYEQTLSFLLEITFDSPILIGQKNVEGFELQFELEDKRTACIQIIPNAKELIGNFQSKFRLRIKDPAFLSHSSKLFTFYFGQVTLRALVACNAHTSQLCISQNIYSHTIHIGIRSADTSISTSSISTDDREKHLMNTKTCILKYPHYSNDLSYYIVMHPISKYFQTLKEDLDVSSLTEEQLKLYEKAKLSQASELQLADKTVEISSFDPASYSMFYHFKSKTSQMLPNGMVFKIVEYINKDIMYLGIFDEPSEENFCANRAEKCPCGNSTCMACYDMEKPNLPYEFVALKADDKRSSCKDPIFKAYDFENTRLVRDFQSQSLSREKKIFNVKSSSVKKKFAQVTSYLPRICMNIDNSDGIFNLKLIFNDYQQTGQASLFAGTTYTLKLYSFSFNEKPNNLNDMDKYFLITPKHIVSIDKVLPNKLLKIRNLDQGNYFLEVYVNQNSSICPMANECVEESVFNNQFQCVPCRKLVVKFLLEYDMLTSSEMSSKSNHNNKNAKFNKFKRKFWSESVAYQVENIDFQKEKYNVFECSKDNQAFGMDLLRSMEIHYEKSLEESDNSLLNGSLSEPEDVLHVYPSLENTNKNRLISAIVPNEYHIEWSYLPYNKAFFVEETEPLVFSLAFILFYIFIGAFLIFLMLFIYWLSQIKKDIFKFEKNIVFYLSIDVNQETQAQLKRVVDKYAKILRKSFKRANIDTIDFKTSADKRFNLIQSADWIVYVCCTPDEIKKLSEPMKFGRNSFQDDYNRIHFGELICKKCINITFNRNANSSTPLTTHSNLNEAPELKNLLDIEQNRTFNSILNSSRASCHLLLPEENHVFTKLLTQHNYNTANIYPIRTLLNIKASNVKTGQNGVLRTGFKQFVCDLCLKHLNLQLKRALTKEYKRNKTLFDNVECTKRDEMFLSDDENYLFRDESSDSQSLFKYSSDNYTSQILRTNSSSSSHE